MARRNQLGTGAIGAAEAAPASVPWWREKDFGRRTITDEDESLRRF